MARKVKLIGTITTKIIKRHREAKLWRREISWTQNSSSEPKTLLLLWILSKISIHRITRSSETTIFISRVNFIHVKHTYVTKPLRNYHGYFIVQTSHGAYSIIILRIILQEKIKAGTSWILRVQIVELNTITAVEEFNLSNIIHG